ncbi:hypothetical protein BC938DRAFT_482558, partial [Jimgerdemannia flammicorona]
MSPRTTFAALKSYLFPFNDLVNGYYFWERNDWSRRHGCHAPWDSWFLLQSVCLVVVDLGFYCFLAEFLDDNNDDDDVRQAAWHTSRWAYTIMLFMTVIPRLLVLVTAGTDTTDPVVVAANVPRSRTYVKQYGIPVIDSHTGVCGICRVKVMRTTRHCKSCNKCVGGMDHHCRWLNCCIGSSNYRWASSAYHGTQRSARTFCACFSTRRSALSVMVCLSGAWIGLAGASIHIVLILHVASFAVARLFRVGTAPTSAVSLQSTIVATHPYLTLSLVVLGLLAVLTFIAAVSMLRLVLFHI